MKQLGLKIIQLDTVDSTNNFAANLLSMGELAHGTVIMADEQTKGRGQRGSKWVTQPAMNLTASFFVQYDNLAVSKQMMINQWISLVIIDMLKKHKISGKIKWPNDIFVNDQKIAGILIENQLSQNKVKSSIIGIGLNVNQVDFGDLNATSIKQHTQNFIPVNEILMQLIESLNRLLKFIIEEDVTRLKELYLLSLWKLNEEISCTVNGETTLVKILGTSDFGLLLMEIDGKEKEFDLKEIQFL